MRQSTEWNFAPSAPPVLHRPWHDLVLFLPQLPGCKRPLLAVSQDAECAVWPCLACVGESGVAAIWPAYIQVSVCVFFFFFFFKYCLHPNEYMIFFSLFLFSLILPTSCLHPSQCVWGSFFCLFFFLILPMSWWVYLRFFLLFFLIFLFST